MGIFKKTPFPNHWYIFGLVLKFTAADSISHDLQKFNRFVYILNTHKKTEISNCLKNTFCFANQTPNEVEEGLIFDLMCYKSQTENLDKLLLTYRRKMLYFHHFTEQIKLLQPQGQSIVASCLMMNLLIHFTQHVH